MELEMAAERARKFSREAEQRRIMEEVRGGLQGALRGRENHMDDCSEGYRSREYRYARRFAVQGETGKEYGEVKDDGQGKSTGKSTGKTVHSSRGTRDP